MAHNFKLRDSSLLCTTGWINNRPARSVAGNDLFDVHDPATGDVWAQCESMDDRDADVAITAANAAFPAFSKVPARTRARMILELDRLFREAKNDFAQLITMESGKSLIEAEGEVEYAGKSRMFQ